MSKDKEFITQDHEPEIIDTLTHIKDLTWENGKLKAQNAYLQGRVRDLEAERDQLAQRISELEAELAEYHQLKDSLRNWKPQLTAPPAAERWERTDSNISVYETVSEFNETMYKNRGLPCTPFRLHSWKMMGDGRVAVMWQRPARQEDEAPDI